MIGTLETQDKWPLKCLDWLKNHHFGTLMGFGQFQTLVFSMINPQEVPISDLLLDEIISITLRNVYVKGTFSAWLSWETFLLTESFLKCASTFSLTWTTRSPWCTFSTLGWFVSSDRSSYSDLGLLNSRSSSNPLFQIFAQSINAIDVTSVTLNSLSSLNAIDVTRVTREWQM